MLRTFVISGLAPAKNKIVFRNAIEILGFTGYLANNFARYWISGTNLMNMKIRLFYLEDDPGFLEQVGPHVGPDDLIQVLLSKNNPICVSDHFDLRDPNTDPRNKK